MVSGVDPSALRAARERAGLTQHELARLVGAAGGERVAGWELGTSAPRPGFLVKLARALGIQPVRLIQLEGEIPDLRALRLKAGLTVPDLIGRANLRIDLLRHGSHPSNSQGCGIKRGALHIASAG